MKILGIDPGFAILGWSVITSDLKLIDYGIITTDSGEDFSERIYRIHCGLSEVIREHRPAEAGIEKLFFAKNTTTALAVAQTVGAVILSLKLSGINYCEYTPLQVKRAITGYGRAAKPQMQSVIKTIFNLDSIPKPDDAADALAVAACHSLNNHTALKRF